MVTAIVAPIERAWHFRELIRAIVSRELASRFRGSLFGWGWAVMAPLVMMFAYTIAFSGIFVIANRSSHTSFGTRSLVIFTGITVFNLFSELLYRSPALLHEHSAFIKKSIFPTETFAWIAVLRALVYASISFGVLVAFELLMTHKLPITALLTPFLVLPLVLLLLGVTWFLMALGAYTRDVTHLMATIVPVSMWVTPVFYNLSDMPPTGRFWMQFNIMGDYIQMFRDIMLTGTLPSFTMYAACAAISYGVFFLGYTYFMRNKAIIIDVL
jgi:lipopolysaccharide transport system permease protein